MTRINLLPYREEARKARRVQFFSLAGLVAALAGVVILLGYTVIEGYIFNQERKNTFLKNAITELDKQIEEINRLQEQTASLLARKQIIESLQRDRSETVHLLRDLHKQTPDGIYLKSVRQEGITIKLEGYAQSNSRVSTLMRNFESAQWLEKPQLAWIRAATVNNRRLNEFAMSVNLKRPKDEAVAKKSEAGKGKP